MYMYINSSEFGAMALTKEWALALDTVVNVYTL
jgi:hypothetical protein